VTGRLCVFVGRVLLVQPGIELRIADTHGQGIGQLVVLDETILDRALKWAHMHSHTRS
jgi:hypothetical protein